MMFIHCLAAFVLALFFAVVPVLADLRSESLKGHNIHRQNAKLEPLIWDCDMENMATKWAKQEAKTKCGVTHSPKADRKVCGDKKDWYCGENMAMSTIRDDDVSPGDDKAATMAKKGCNMWYDEWKNYKYQEDNYQGCDGYDLYKSGHITAMMWADTKKIGCGAAQCTNNPNNWVYTCNYDGMGNIKESTMFPAQNFLNLCATEKGKWTSCVLSLENQCLNATAIPAIDANSLAKDSQPVCSIEKSGENRAVSGRYVIMMSVFTYLAIHKLLLNNLH